MKKNEVKKRKGKSVQISIRTSKENAEFMAKEKLSPNSIFDLALKELKNEK